MVSFIVVGLSILSQTFYWQRKEYRWDRMSSHLSGPDGNIFYCYWLTAAFALTGTAWLGFFFSQFGLASGLGWLALLAFATHHLTRIQRQGVLRPDFTMKALVVIGLAILVTYAYWQLLYLPSSIDSVQWATLLLFVPGMVALSVGVIHIPFTWAKQRVITKAALYRRQNPQVTAIGITGSYGKTSTKFFLQQLLHAYHGVVTATRDHRNSEIAVAEDMLANIRPSTDIYIAEMGAYRRGEISALMQLVQPTIGILTAIGNQHLDLFGSTANLFKAKQELLVHLPANGVAVLNADDVNVVNAAKVFSGTKIWYSASKPADMYAADIVVEPRQVTATIHIGKDSQTLSIPLASRGLLQSVLAAVAGAHAVGMSAADIFAALPTLKAFPRTMELRGGKDGITIIDDSYSAGEQSVLNALHHLTTFAEKHKIIVMVPLIELHQQGAFIHERLGLALAQTNAQVYIYGHSYQQNLTKGFNALKGSGSIAFFSDPVQLKKEVSNALRPLSIVLLEGRIPAVLRSSLFS